MAILIDRKTRVLIQGVTGTEGSRACKEMLAYHTKVLAGVTPGKGGQSVNGVPVYNTVREALERHPDINTTLVVVPAPFVKDAVMEAIFAGIKLINVLTEHVPTQDAAYIVEWARKRNAFIVGPSSVGIMVPGIGKIGSIGSSAMSKIYTQGPIGVISKSGGMSGEIGVVLSRARLGQSTIVGIGGDQIVGADFVDLLKLFESDKKTKAVVLFGEVGGTYEELAAEYIKKSRYPKPVVAVVAGSFTEKLPQGTVLGHAGAIVSKGRGSYYSKVREFKKAGVQLATTLEDIPRILKKLL
jgi:succinyl-CoA synthetase alpha subunit